MPAPLLFLLSGLTQYVGAAVAVRLFGTLAPTTVAWLRIAIAAVLLLVWARPWRAPLRGRRLATAAVFGVVLGVATGLRGASLGMAAALLPLGIAMLLRPDWLPVALMVTVFAEAFTIGGVSISRAAGPLALGLLALQIRHDTPARLRDLDWPLAWCIGLYALWAFASPQFSGTKPPTAFIASMLIIAALGTEPPRFIADHSCETMISA